MTPGDVHDSVPYLSHLEQIHRNTIHLQAAAADSAYDFPLAHRELEKLGIDFFVRPQPAQDRTQVELKTRCVHLQRRIRHLYLPQRKAAAPQRGCTRSNSGLFWEYWADRAECGYCPLREKCLGERAWHGARRLLDSYFKPSVQRGRARAAGVRVPAGPEGRGQVWCEGTFAIQKRCHMSWCWGAHTLVTKTLLVWALFFAAASWRIGEIALCGPVRLYGVCGDGGGVSDVPERSCCAAAPLGRRYPGRYFALVPVGRRSFLRRR